MGFWQLFAQWVLPALATGGMSYLGAHKQAGAARHGAELQAAGTQRALDWEMEEDKYARQRDEEQRARDWRLEQIDRDRAEVDRQRNIEFEATDRRRQQEYEDLVRARYNRRGDMLAPWLDRAGQNRGRLSGLLAQGPAISPEAIARQDPRLLESGRPDLLAGGSAMQVGGMPPPTTPPPADPRARAMTAPLTGQNNYNWWMPPPRRG